MRRALIVGFDAYPASPLAGCVNDALAVETLLARNEDGSPNFTCEMLTAPPRSIPPKVITKANLRGKLKHLFADEADVALLYFSGHGTENNLGGYLVTPDAEEYDEGVPMEQVITLANASKAREVVIILDCCHSGALGNPPVLSNQMAIVREGVAVLTASRATQVSVELVPTGKGLFTSILCEAAACTCFFLCLAQRYDHNWQAE